MLVRVALGCQSQPDLHVGVLVPLQAYLTSRRYLPARANHAVPAAARQQRPRHVAWLK
jgi:hypothetical protein